VRSTTLRSQLTRTFMLTALIALALNACLIVAYEFDRYRDEAVDELHTQETILAKALVPSLVFNDPEAAAQQLASLAERRDIRIAEVFSANGRPFARYHADPQGTGEPPAQNPLPSLGSRFSGDDLELAYDVYHDGERVGTLYLRAHHDVLRRIGSYAAIQTLVMAASLVLALLVFSRVQARITAPIARVARVAQEVMVERDWRLRAPAAETREIAALVEAFNGMLAEMEANSAELGREVAERKRAEESLRAADRRKDEFLATLAHEIRNPLAPMMNALSLLRREDLPPAARGKALGILDRQLRHVVRLIDDLLDVSRITTGKLSLQMSHVDLHQVLRSALELIEPTARGRRLQLHGAIGAAPCWLIGDSARLLQVFSNLLSNACRYTPEGGRIDVRAECDGNEARIDVRDTGVGIEPAMQERVFDLFEQGDKSLERGNTGLGIGLTLARQLVLLHGGSIGVASDGIGRGSTFTVRLPTAATSTIAAPEARPAAAPASLARLDVLVADDNLDFAVSLQVALESAGIAVRTVENGQAALSAARSRPPDVAILDIGMPQLNGYDLARALRADPSTAGIVLFAVSGWGQASDKDQASKAGFDRHFVKPVPPETLLEALAGAVVQDLATKVGDSHEQ
jgi:signal transduction histidine kinase/ActR/RegA family two-component response regulator